MGAAFAGVFCGVLVAGRCWLAGTSIGVLEEAMVVRMIGRRKVEGKENGGDEKRAIAVAMLVVVVVARCSCGGGCRCGDGTCGVLWGRGRGKREREKNPTYGAVIESSFLLRMGSDILTELALEKRGS